MSAAAMLLAIVKPLAEPLALAVLQLVKEALAGKDVSARAEAVATLAGFKGAISAAAEAKRDRIRNAVRRVSLFDREGNFGAYVSVAGTPGVVLHGGRAYVAMGDFGTTNSYREVEHEEAA